MLIWITFYDNYDLAMHVNSTIYVFGWVRDQNDATNAFGVLERVEDLRLAWGVDYLLRYGKS